MMSIYNFAEYDIRQVDDLEAVWNGLQGPDMSYFQTFGWYRMQTSAFPADCRRFVTRFVVISKGDKPVMIAPLWIVRKTFNFLNKKGVYIFGRGGWTDYLDFIYKEFDSEAVKALFAYISEKYNQHNWFLENIREASPLYAYVKDNVEVQSQKSTKCVKLQLPESEELYNKLLSKRSRQNIRTARNRMAKNNIVPETVFSGYSAQDALDAEAMRAVRVKRKVAAYALWKRMALKVLNKLWFNGPKYFPLRDTKSSDMLSLRNGGEIMAYFNYGVNAVGTEAVMMAVGTADKYQWFSPGIVAMYDFIIKTINDKSLKTIDFTRGDEPYKYALGGTDHFIHSLSFKV